MVESLLLTIPPEFPPAGIGDFLDYLKLGSRFRKRGRKQLTGLVNIFTKSAADFLDDWFESEEIKVTLATDGATRIDFGANIHLAVAMAIAVLKASLVILFFMHLKYDRLFHTVIFISAICAASLFVGFTLMDTGQYQQTNIWTPSSPPRAPFGPRPTTG